MPTNFPTAGVGASVTMTGLASRATAKAGAGASVTMTGGQSPMPYPRMNRRMMNSYFFSAEAAPDDGSKSISEFPNIYMGMGNGPRKK